MNSEFKNVNNPKVNCAAVLANSFLYFKHYYKANLWFRNDKNYTGEFECDRFGLKLIGENLIQLS